MATPSLAATWLFLAALPICLWVIWADLARMKIPNLAVGALVVIFAVVGFLTLPVEDWAWRWLHLLVMLVACVAIYAIGAMGAGDAKFIAAAAPFVAYDDWPRMVVIVAGVFLAAYAIHRIARATPLRKLAPDWKSWAPGKRFPMGFPLAASLLVYLGLAATAA